MPPPSSTSGSRLRGLRAWALLFAVLAPVLLGLDRLAWSRRNALVDRDVGPWAEPQWLQRRRLLEGDPYRGAPDLLFLGDSAVGYGIHASLIRPKAFNLSRLGLHASELPELDVKLRRSLRGRPKTIVMGLLWYEFLDTAPEQGFLQGHSHAPREALQAFYSDPQ